MWLSIVIAQPEGHIFCKVSEKRVNLEVKLKKLIDTVLSSQPAILMVDNYLCKNALILLYYYNQNEV